ncbi:hypothetical protein [Spirosoma areae]
MKTYLIALFVASVGTAFAQNSDLVPTTSASWAGRQFIRIKNQLRQPPPPPVGGFWVVEEAGNKKDPAIVRYYTDQRVELHTDTLRRAKLRLHKRSVVNQLNGKLALLLGTSDKPASVAFRRTLNHE